jgi:hypothetical protein
MRKKKKSFLSILWVRISGFAIILGILACFIDWPKYKLFTKTIKNTAVNKYPIDFTLGAFRYRYDKYNIILCDTFELFPKQTFHLLIEYFPIAFMNTTTSDIEDFRFKFIHSNDLYPECYGPKKKNSLFHDATFESGRTKDFFAVMYKNITLHPKESYRITEDFLILPLHKFIKQIDIEPTYFEKESNISIYTNNPILTNRIDVFYSAKNFSEQHKVFRVGKLYANNWDSIVYRYVKELELSKLYYSELNLKNKDEWVAPIDTASTTFLILNTINKTDDKKVFIAEVKFENIAIVTKEGHKLYIENFDNKIKYVVDMEKHNIVNYSK